MASPTTEPTTESVRSANDFKTTKRQEKIRFDELPLFVECALLERAFNLARSSVLFPSAYIVGQLAELEKEIEFTADSRARWESRKAAGEKYAADELERAQRPSGFYWP